MKKKLIENQTGDILYYGGSNTIPETAHDIKAMAVAPHSSEVIINASTIHRINNIAIKSGYIILEAKDIDNPVCNNVDYRLSSTLKIRGVAYNVYSFELGIPYSLNYRHKFLIAKA